jgi:O-antigen ligase
MLSTYFFIVGTLLLSLNLVRPFGLAISDWFYFGALALAIIETMLVDHANFSCWIRNCFLWCASLILLGATISTAHSIFWNVAVLEIVQQLYIITLFISLIWVMVRRGKLDIIVKAFIWSGVFTASIAVVDYLSGTNFGPRLSGTPYVQFWGRFAGTLGHPNKFGFFLTITSTLSLAWIMRIQPERSTIPSRIFWTMLFLVQVFGIYLSGSLTAYLGMLLGIGVFIVSSRSTAKRFLNIMVPALWIGLMIVGLLLISDNSFIPESIPLGSSLIMSALDRVQMTTGPSRLVIFEQALQEIIKNPFVGAGYDQISTSGIDFLYRSLQGTIHNTLLQIFYTGGLFAFIGWLTIYFSLGWTAFVILRGSEKKSVSPLLLGIAAAVLAILLMDQFQDAVYQREKWLVFGLLIGKAWDRSGLLTLSSPHRRVPRVDGVVE